MVYSYGGVIGLIHIRFFFAIAVVIVTAWGGCCALHMLLFVEHPQKIADHNISSGG